MRKSGGCRKIHLVVMSILLMATGIAIAQPSTAAVIVRVESSSTDPPV